MEGIQKSSLSEPSKANYQNRIKQLTETFDADLLEIIRNPKRYSKQIEKVWKETKTRRNMMSVILSVFKYNKSLRDKENEAYEEWTQIYKTMNDVYEGEVKQNKATDKQEAGMIQYDEIKTKMKLLPEGSKDRLLLAIYGLIDPMRADYGDIKIYWNREPSAIKNKENYMVLREGSAPSHIILNQYKTAKAYGRFEKELPKELEKEVITSMISKPRTYLFEDRDGKPYTATNFSNWANRTFKKVFGKPTTISIIRHSRINSIDMNTTTIAEKEQIAKGMGHSTTLQDQYRLIH